MTGLGGRSRVDVTRASASRPALLAITTPIWRARAHSSGELRWLLHEDVLDRGLSDACLAYARGAGGYAVVREDLPPLGHMGSLGWLWGQADTDYVLNVEDDWVLLEEIDLDRLCGLMDQHPDVNQIAFHKRPVMAYKGTYQKRQRTVDGVLLASSPHWNFIPSLFRRAWVQEQWAKGGGCFATHWEFNQYVKREAPLELTPDWTDQYLGTYFLGGVGCGTPFSPDTSFYVQHLGVQSTRTQGAAAVSGGPPRKVVHTYSGLHPNLYYGDIFLTPEEVRAALPPSTP